MTTARYTIHTEPGSEGFVVTTYFDDQPEVTFFPELDAALDFLRFRLFRYA